MKIAILEPDLEELDRALETFSSAGHICFGARCDERLRYLLGEVSADLILIDWSNPDSERYATLQYLAQYESAIPVVLCVSPHTAHAVIESGLKHGASFSIEKRSCNFESLDSLHALAANRFLPVSAAGHRLM
jgi:DNA-binding NarL/FixJ family response regulator